MTDESMDEHATDELRELLGAFALDAVNDEERAAIDALLDHDAAARDELRSYLAVAAALASERVEPPATLWASIAAAARAERPEPAPTPLERVAGPRFVSANSERGRTRHRRRARAAFGPAAAAAVVALTIGGIQEARVQAALRLERKAQAELASARAGSADSVVQGQFRRIAVRGSRRADLTDEAGHVVARVVIGADGQGVVLTQQTRRLPPGHTYQLWAVRGTEVLSVGVLGAAPEGYLFAAVEQWDKLVLTDEVAPGVNKSSQPAAAAGDIHSI